MGSRSKYVTDDVLDKYIHLLPQKDALALEVCRATGLRIGDVLKIEKKALKSPDTIVYRAQKTGKKGEKKISPELFERLKDSGNGRWCFPSPRNGRRKRSRQAVYIAMKREALKGGLPRASPHSARKAYAVALAKKAGFDAVARELQHTHYDTTILYALADVLEARAKGKEDKTDGPNG